MWFGLWFPRSACPGVTAAVCRVACSLPGCPASLGPRGTAVLGKQESWGPGRAQADSRVCAPARVWVQGPHTSKETGKSPADCFWEQARRFANWTAYGEGRHTVCGAVSMASREWTWSWHAQDTLFCCSRAVHSTTEHKCAPGTAGHEHQMLVHVMSWCCGCQAHVFMWSWAALCCPGQCPGRNPPAGGRGARRGLGGRDAGRGDEGLSAQRADKASRGRGRSTCPRVGPTARC